jgi:hypothetical protein
MSDTVNSYPIGFAWVDLNTVSSIVVGKPFYIQNTGQPQDVIVLAVSATEPAADFKGVNLYQKEIKPVLAGNSTTWARLVKVERDTSTARTALINIQENSPSIGGALPSVEVGAWGYNSGSLGTLTLTGGKRVLQISAISLEVAGSITINGGDLIRLPYGNVDKVSTEMTIYPKGNLIDPVIVFVDTDSYFVEYVT